VRRFELSRAILSRAVAIVASSSRPGEFPGRHFLYPFKASREIDPSPQGIGRRIPHGAAHRRDGGTEHLGLYSDELDLDYGRANLPYAGVVSKGRSSGYRHRKVRISRGGQSATPGLSGRRRRLAGVLFAVRRIGSVLAV